MDSMLDTLVAYFLMYGIPVLGISIIIGSNAIPSGAIILAVAAGAFAYAGDFVFWQLLLWVWFFNVLGDTSSYWIWRAFGPAIREKFLSTSHYLALSMRQAAEYLEKYGLASIFISRFPLAGLGPPINILSGLSAYHYPRFMLAIVPGDLIYSAFTLGVGYWFGDAWQAAGSTLNQYSQLISAVTALIVVLWLLWPQVRKQYVRLKPHPKPPVSPD
ncbi:MAG: VTT domain-containing protein [Syntrophomonadaceae bacterium]